MSFAIFDLDNTLVDSLHLKPLRDRRDWAAVYARIPRLTLFDGVRDTWDALRRRRVRLAVVTHSPRPYASRVLERLGLEPDTLIAYHDLAGRLKPLPDGYRAACPKSEPLSGVAIGDDRNDLLAADAFGCRGIFAAWARQPAITAAECTSHGWTYAARPDDLLALLETRPS